MGRRTFLTKCKHFHVSLVWLSQNYFRVSVATPSKFARGRKPNGVTSAIFKESGRLYSGGKFMFKTVIDSFFWSQVFWRGVKTEHSQLINAQWDLMLKPFCAGWMSQLGLRGSNDDNRQAYCCWHFLQLLPADCRLEICIFSLPLASSSLPSLCKHIL